MLKCYTANGSYSATFIVSKVDGNPLFFPVDRRHIHPCHRADRRTNSTLLRPDGDLAV